MKISPAMLIAATGTDNLQPGAVKGLFNLASPVTLLHTETGEVVEINKFFHDERNVEESMVRVVQPSKLPPWVPLAQFELPPTAAKLLAARAIHEFDRQNNPAG